MRGLHEHKDLPKLIVVVLDDDLTKTLRNVSDFSLNAGKLLNWLLNEVRKLLDAYKDLLPQKAKQAEFPHVLWMAPALHKFLSNEDNMRREKFSRCLGQAVSYQQRMSMLHMVKYWDSEDGDNFIHDAYRYTSNGLFRYWLSIDSAVRYWFTAVLPKLIKPHSQRKKTNVNHQPNDRFHWSSKRARSTMKHHNNKNSQRRPLPTPP